MKTLITTAFIFIQSIVLFAQVSEVEKCGLDSSPTLNTFEANCFNEVYQDRKGEFDFSGKVIAFYKGSAGTTTSSKSDYFYFIKNSGRPDTEVHQWQARGTQLLILTEEEKLCSGGFDAILVSWSKLQKEGRSRKKLVKRLNKISS